MLIGMSGKCAAVFSCLGLGDGLIALVLANNLRLQGVDVTLFHPFLEQLQNWFPSIKISPFPSVDALSAYDAFYIIYEKSERMFTILNYCEQHFPFQTVVLNPIATRRKNYPYWSEGKFEGTHSFVDNLVAFCHEGLKIDPATKDNGIYVPEGVKVKRYTKRVVLHPTSSRPSKDWPMEKFIELAHLLHQEGFDPVFILSQEERKGWDLSKIQAPLFSNLHEMATYVAESGYMIGNDSGIGHLASCLGLPTVTVCRNHQVAKFWRPGWSQGSVVTPYPWIPNIKGMRWRDQYWKRWVSVKRVMREFLNQQDC